MIGRLFAGIVLTATVVAAVAGQAANEIFVDANAAAGGNGSAAAPYRTIREAVDDANLQPGTSDLIIRVAEGTYLEDVNVTITRDGVRLLGSSVALLDQSGLPTGSYAHASTVRPNVAPGTLVPAGAALIRVNASRVEIGGLALDGGVPKPPAGSPGGTLLMIDGAPNAARKLDDVSVHDNAIVNTANAAMIHLANAVFTGNFLARNSAGVIAFGGFENVAHPELERQLTFTRNRFVEHNNGGLVIIGTVGSLTVPTFTQLGLVAGPSAVHAQVATNDFQRNSNGPAYPQAIQYSALLFNTTNGSSSDPTQPTRVDADIRDNRFIENGYGISITQRVSTSQTQGTNAIEARLTANSYCGNGLNDAFFNFNLNSQSHGATAGGATFRYSVESTYVIDAKRRRGDAGNLHPEI